MLKDKEKKKKSSLSLPKELSKPLTDPSQAINLIYGEKKIGKTSIASQFGKQKPTDKSKVLFLMCEPGGKGLEIYQRTPRNWDDIRSYIDLLEKDEFFTTVVIDTADKFYDKCFDYVCIKERMKFPTYKPYGEGWKAVKKEMIDQIDRLIHTGKGLVILSHANIEEVTSHSGKTYQKIVPTMAKQPNEYFTGLADNLCFYGYYGNERRMTIAGSDEIEAGTRLENNFWVAGKVGNGGERVHSIPMGKSKEEAYQNFMKAFRNEQKTSGEPDKKAVLKSAVKKKLGGKR